MSDSESIDWGEVSWKEIDLDDSIDFVNVDWGDLDKKDYKSLKKFNQLEGLQIGTARKKESFKGSGSAETIIGGLGKDIINGGGGDDVVLGTSTEKGGGRKEKDTLTGGAGKDLFVLGSDSGILYDDGKKKSGKKDFAQLTDFEPGVDSLQLYGDANDYFVKPKSNAEIFFDSNSNDKLDKSDELIAKVKGLSTQGFETALQNASYKIIDPVFDQSSDIPLL